MVLICLKAQWKNFVNVSIRLDVSSVAHPQSNGQAETANQEILKGLKPRLMVPLQWMPGCWVEELPSVLWRINTTANRSTGYTPFFMVYGAEAVLPSDHGVVISP